MENHPSTSYHHQCLPFSNNFLLDQEQVEEKPSTTLPIFDSSTTILHVPSVDNLVKYNNQQPYNNPKRKRSRFLKITTPTTCSSSAAAGKPRITKKPPDPSAPKITRPCTECGKKFGSWKALFGHMRCHPERQWRGINPPPNFRPPPPPSLNNNNNNVDNSASEFSPRKTPKLLDHVIMTDEDREIAESLLQLAKGSSKPDDIVNNDDENVVKDMPCSSSGGGGGGKDLRFECSGCKKVFGSHQALGGHRASHKNVKGCYASGSVSGSGLTVQAVNNTNLDLNFPPPVTLISGDQDQYDSSSSYTCTYSGSALDLRLKL